MLTCCAPALLPLTRQEEDSYDRALQSVQDNMGPLVQACQESAQRCIDFTLGSEAEAWAQVLNVSSHCHG